MNLEGKKHTGKYCNVCEIELTSWDLRCSKALAYKYPICEGCISKEYEKTEDELREIMEDYFGMRPCQGL